MEALTQFFPAGILLFFVVSVIAVKQELVKRPTFKESNERYKETKVCDEIHKSVDEKLRCIPGIEKTVTQIETKIDIILEKHK